MLPLDSSSLHRMDSSWRLHEDCSSPGNKKMPVSKYDCFIVRHSTEQIYMISNEKKKRQTVFCCDLWKFVERYKPCPKVGLKLLVILIPLHFQFHNCCSFSEKELKSTRFKPADGLHFLKIISLSDDLQWLSICKFTSFLYLFLRCSSTTSTVEHTARQKFQFSFVA